MLVLFIVSLMAAALAPSVRDLIERGRRDAESRALDELATAISASFEQTDLTNLNIAALPGEIGPGDTATAFSTSTNAAYATTAANDWFAKLARA
ncbi:MAG: hypothetical protein NDI75_14745, partial [Candidatus Didemnitutus sp.]|nr:hypothetical protein [Candidatus Didemnitutus sp.]